MLPANEHWSSAARHSSTKFFVTQSIHGKDEGACSILVEGSIFKPLSGFPEGRFSLTTESISYNEYDGFNRLTGVTSGVTTAAYTYDSDGLRTSKTVNGVTTKHVWDGDQIVLEIWMEQVA